ncbi:cyclin-dependent kinase inhibitor 1 isoform X2 [Paramormyrops kingsleyae]|uniref:Cyclin dependent kinase inhibitor 1A n=1 Tax=Paramormyrops kingsleyae TaxID=1676925 RepID=A0A3B3R647_9TELE|nr:cyclin-dependent kinase inhibitor 1-like isoform X2 [Paramormyrops kingsleyae]
MCRIMPINKPVLEALRTGPVRRNLFGQVDHEQMKKDHEDLLQDDLKDKTCRWGFDFVGDVPLENHDFQWVALPEDQVPALYRPSVVRQGMARKLGAVMENLEEEAEDDFESTSRTAAQNVERMPETKQKYAVKRKQTNITDYYQAKRRAVKTPRKSGQ